ncbi:MAG: hypothetical protein R3F34_06960 [Planctomycetota bacterium]
MRSRSGLYALEGGGGRKGAVLYDFAAISAGVEGERMLGDDGVLPVGFFVGSDGTEFAATSAKGPLGLALWAPEDGRLLAPGIPAVAEVRATACATLVPGRRALLRLSRLPEAPGAAPPPRLAVYAFD